MKPALKSLTSNKLFWILALAFVVRFFVALLLPDQHFPDAGSYRTAADELRHLQFMANNNIMPLYPLLIALVGGGWGQTLADLALSVAAVWLAYAIALRIYRDETIALIVALFCALWPHFVFFAAVGLTETLFIALILAAFVCLYDRRYALGSVFLVLAILTRPAIDFLAPILVVLFSLLLHRERPSRTGFRLLTYALIYVALMSPWWAYNYARYDRFVRLDLGGGMVLYTGNNPMNVSGGGVAPDDADLRAFMAIRNPVERDRAFEHAAVAYIEQHPWRFVTMMPAKLARLWRPWPYADEYQNTWIVLLSVTSALAAFGLALAGLAFTLRSHFVPLLPCLIYVAFLTAVHMVTIGSVRYRVPLEPMVLILAAAGLVELLRRAEVGRRLLAPLSSRR